jgi:hypothetical protein
MKLIPLEEFDQYVPPGEAVEPTRKAFPLKFLGDLKVNLTNRWAVKGLLPAQGLAVVYGAPETGKSFLMLKLALHMAIGRDFAGRKATRTGVIYISAEAGSGFESRAAAARDAMGMTARDPFALLPVAPDLGRSDGDAQILVEQIREQTQLAGWIPGCIVIDTAARVMPGQDENSSRDMGALIRNCDLLAKQFDALVCLVHHSGKIADAGMRGSSALLGGADAVIGISKDDEGVRTAKIEKMKEGEGGLSFNFRLEPVMLGNDDDGEAVTTCLVEGVTDLTRVERKTRTGPSVPASLRLFMNVFDGVISEHGTDERPIADMPVVRCIGIEKLRTAFYARRGDETPEAKRQAFKRGLDQAMSRKDILATDQDGKALLWRA